MKNDGRFQLVLKLCCDSIAIVFSWLLAGTLRFFVIPGGKPADFLLFLRVAILVLLFNIFFISKNGLYKSDLEQSWRKDTSKIVYSAFEAFLLLVVTLYFVFPLKVSRLSIGLHFILILLFLVLERTIVSGYIKNCYRKGRYTRKILLVGYGSNLINYEKALHNKRVLGIHIVGQYDGEEESIGEVKPIHAQSLRDAVEATEPDLVVLGYPATDYARQQRMVAQALDLLTEKVILLPTLPESYIGTQISDFRWIPLLTLNAAEIGVFQHLIKRSFDVVACLAGVVLISPILAIIALLIKLTSPGPIIFKQKRITKNENVFTMYKFRSMRIDMPEGEVHWTEENDPRITKIGRFLRKTSLDELPQLFNVIGGSMSLIGPRPERPPLVEKFNSEIPGYRMRHRFKAGISGWAQVNGWRGNTSLERRIEFDLFYIRNWSLFFDLKIIFYTFFRGFVNENAY